MRFFLHRDCLTKEGLKKCIDGRDTENMMPSNRDVLESVTSNEYTNEVVKAVLYMLESGLSESLSSTKLKDFSSYTVEHTMPKKWKDNWMFDGDTTERNRKVRKMGNLTLLVGKLNSKLQNSGWQKKREEMKQPKYNIKGLVTNQCGDGKYVCDCEVWDEDRISERELWLGEQMLIVWDGEDMDDMNYADVKGGKKINKIERLRITCPNGKIIEGKQRNAIIEFINYVGPEKAVKYNKVSWKRRSGIGVSREKENENWKKLCEGWWVIVVDDKDGKLEYVHGFGEGYSCETI